MVGLNFTAFRSIVLILKAAFSERLFLEDFDKDSSEESVRNVILLLKLTSSQTETHYAIDKVSNTLALQEISCCFFHLYLSGSYKI